MAGWWLNKKTPEVAVLQQHVCGQCKAVFTGELGYLEHQCPARGYLRPVHPDFPVRR